MPRLYSTPTKHLRQAVLAEAGFAQPAAVSPSSAREPGGQREPENQQGPSRNQQTGPLNPHTGAQEAEGRHPHAHKIKDFIQHGSLRKQGKRRAPESPPNQRATQRHAGEDGQPPRSGGANPASGQGTNPSGVTPTGGNALAPRGGASAPKQDLDWGQTMRFFRKDGKQL